MGFTICNVVIMVCKYEVAWKFLTSSCSGNVRHQDHKLFPEDMVLVQPTADGVTKIYEFLRRGGGLDLGPH